MSDAPANGHVITGVYLLHFDPPYRHAKHYLGFADDIFARVRDHQEGVSGVALLEAARAAGVVFSLARIWPGATRQHERAAKATKTGKRSRPRGSNSTGSRGRLCPLCNPGTRSTLRDFTQLK